MAHKGRVYPYAPPRDLSLAPGATWGLPLNYTWSGIVATGTYASLFNGKSFKVAYNGHTYTAPGFVYWDSIFPGGPFGNFHLRIHYSLSSYPIYSRTEWYLDWGGFTHMLAPARPNAIGWPQVVLGPPTVNSNPSQLNFTTAGIINPRPWPA